VWPLASDLWLCRRVSTALPVARSLHLGTFDASASLQKKCKGTPFGWTKASWMYFACFGPNSLGSLLLPFTWRQRLSPNSRLILSIHGIPVCLGNCRVIRDAWSGASPISIHWRRSKSERVADYKTHLRYMVRVCVSDLIPGWAPYDTNTRRSQCRRSPITKKYKMSFILERRRLNCRLGSLRH
jgi:hypothetical protein